MLPTVPYYAGQSWISKTLFWPKTLFFQKKTKKMFFFIVFIVFFSHKERRKVTFISLYLRRYCFCTFYLKAGVSSPAFL